MDSFPTNSDLMDCDPICSLFSMDVDENFAHVNSTVSKINQTIKHEQGKRHKTNRKLQRVK